MSENFKFVEYYEVYVVKAIDRETKEGEMAWKELVNHHAIPYVKPGRYLLSQFWMAYTTNPYENLEIWKEEAGESWDGEGMLAKVIADYILKIKPDFNEWEKVLLYVDW